MKKEEVILVEDRRENDLQTRISRLAVIDSGWNDEQAMSDEEEWAERIGEIEKPQEWVELSQKQQIASEQVEWNEEQLDWSVASEWVESKASKELE